MATYRYQVVSVGYWRGQVKRWNTTFHRSSSDQVTALYNAMQAAGYTPAGDVTGACSGGVASIAVYASTGGAPLSNTVYFDWATPSTWIPYTGVCWASIDNTTPLDASGESAAVVIGHLPGLSASGKPMSTRKYLHAIPSRTATAYLDPDIDATVRGELEDVFVGWMDSPSGVSPFSIECSAYYLNHQRVRGRRRTVASVATDAYAAGVATGAAAGSAAAGGSGFGGSF